MTDPLAPLLPYLRHTPRCETRARVFLETCSCGFDTVLAEVAASVPTLSDEERLARWAKEAWVALDEVNRSRPSGFANVAAVLARFPDLGDQ